MPIFIHRSQTTKLKPVMWINSKTGEVETTPLKENLDPRILLHVTGMVDHEDKKAVTCCLARLENIKPGTSIPIEKNARREDEIDFRIKIDIHLDTIKVLQKA